MRTAETGVTRGIGGDTAVAWSCSWKKEQLPAPPTVPVVSRARSAWVQVTLAFWPAALNEEVNHFEKRKLFILVSTVMTWARSKPLDPVSSATSLSLGQHFSLDTL